ncbi:MAG: hypothetical protein A2287_07460 [Candidatus Melainabacteria bacterium RIFOXYA12_FULL_32_12]|nr:MAG: hypothetical protein A2255_09510 [Candidatus Melainabacteria bacterium RIFOXYA2_FULL_32_9]OGI30024.1 MAG: hypothetical protein A2287_07460 [Candidatus Melainabacteria bacterium RIFOXYA12_FULL_32_12]
MGISIGDIIKAGYEGYKAGKTTKSTQKYLKERIPELQKLGYDNTTIQKMVYFELGYNEIAGTMYKAVRRLGQII